MAETTGIQWTDATANFWWGCFKVSAGCQNCYADTLAHRYGKEIWGPAKTTSRELKKGIWRDLPKWNRKANESGKRMKVFVMSMGDFFEDHPQVTEWRNEALSLIQECKNIDFQVLTKRPENVNRMIETSTSHSFSDVEMWFYANPHVWIGTSIENQETANERIPELLMIPAEVRFLSMEPLLGPVDLSKWIGEYYCCWCNYRGFDVGEVKNDEWGDKMPTCPDCGADKWYFAQAEHHGALDENRYNPIDWVIVGGESGPNARPMHPDWARSIRDQCQAAGVPFFFKQWGEWLPIEQSGDGWGNIPPNVDERWIGEARVKKVAKVGKKAAGRLLDGREWNEYPVQS